MRKLIITTMFLLILPLPTYAQVGGINLGSSADQPINIESDTLTVKPGKNMAVFKGKVKAEQGDVTLKSDNMTVFYSNDNGTKNDNKDMSGKQLSKIETAGNVILTVPGKSAKSDQGKYDVEKEYIVLTGNVELTQDNNKLRGEKFLYNMRTGESRMQSGSGSTGPSGGRAKATFGGNSSNNSGKTDSGRVKGFLIPKEKPSTPR